MTIKFLEVKRAYYADPENVVVQFRYAGIWSDCAAGDEPVWDAEDYRIRPRIIRIGEIDVPEPVRGAVAGDLLYVCNPAGIGKNIPIVFKPDDIIHMMWVSSGLAHRSLPNAEQHAKALIIVSGGKV